MEITIKNHLHEIQMQRLTFGPNNWPCDDFRYDTFPSGQRKYTVGHERKSDGIGRR